MNKEFIFKDKTGRGIVTKVSSQALLENPDEEDYDGSSLHEWVEDADLGDQWHNSTMQLTCISEN